MLYEIDMLRETAGQLEKDKWQGNFHKWVVLESFLLHFRNLIEFFGRPDPRGTDLSIQKPEGFWTDAANRPADAVLARLRNPDLWAKYEGTNNPYSISKYLQHCTEHRVDAKDWAVSDMYNEIRVAVDEFERLLPDTTRPWTQPTIQAGAVLLGPASASTATATKRGNVLGLPRSG